MSRTSSASKTRYDVHMDSLPNSIVAKKSTSATATGALNSGGGTVMAEVQNDSDSGKHSHSIRSISDDDFDDDSCGPMDPSRGVMLPRIDVVESLSSTKSSKTPTGRGGGGGSFTGAPGALTVPKARGVSSTKSAPTPTSRGGRGSSTGAAEALAVPNAKARSPTSSTVSARSARSGVSSTAGGGGGRGAAAKVRSPTSSIISGRSVRSTASSGATKSVRLRAPFEEEFVLIDRLNEDEQRHLEKVVQRDAEMRRADSERCGRLNVELLRVKAPIPGWEVPHHCSVCAKHLGLFNSGLACVQCGEQVCKKTCAVTVKDGDGVYCKKCFSENLTLIQTNEWFNQLLRKSKPTPLRTGSDILRTSLVLYKEKEAEMEAQRQEGISLISATEFNMDSASALCEPTMQSAGKSHSKKNESSHGSTGSRSGWRFGRKGKSKSKQGSDEVDTLTTFDGAIMIAAAAEVPSETDSSPSARSRPSCYLSDTDRGSSVVSFQRQFSSIREEEAEAEADDVVAVAASAEAASDAGRDVPPELHGSYGNLQQAESLSRQSMMSLYSENDESYALGVDVSGELEFGLEYDFRHEIFVINVKSAKDLAAINLHKRRSDPYVKSYLLPDKTKVSKRKTSFKRGTLCPKFNERLKYPISKADLESRTLWISVWHHVNVGNNIFLGEVHVPMSEYEFTDMLPQYHKLTERKRIAVPMQLLLYKGDLEMAIKFASGDQDNYGLTSSDVHSDVARSNLGIGELHVFVKEGRNLVAARSSGFSDPFVKGVLLPNKVKRKTHVVRHSCNPSWNCVLCYKNVDYRELNELCVQLTVWDYGRFMSNEFLGGLRLNLGLGLCKGTHANWMDAKGYEQSIWQEMINRPDTWIDATIMLRSHMD